jgi:hypothetical protein
MEHFVRIVMEKQESINRLDESVFPRQEIYETAQGATVIEIPLARQLSETESDEYAKRLANYMFESGYSDFDIEISTDDDKFIEEITLDGNDFFEEFGVMWYNEDETLDEAEYQGRKVALGKPMRGDVKKFKVYVKNPQGNVVKVNFGDPDMKIKKSNPARRRSFRARHNCDNPGPRHKARYWSCRKW